MSKLHHWQNKDMEFSHSRKFSLPSLSVRFPYYHFASKQWAKVGQLTGLLSYQPAPAVCCSIHQSLKYNCSSVCCRYHQTSSDSSTSVRNNIFFRWRQSNTLHRRTEVDHHWCNQFCNSDYLCLQLGHLNRQKTFIKIKYKF